MKNTNEIPRLLRWKEVSKIIPFSRSYVYELMSKGKFPKGYKLIPGGRAVGWWEHEIHALVEQRHQDTRGGNNHE